MIDAPELSRRLLDREPSTYAPWMDRRRCRAVVESGLPGPRSEPWKYTNPARWYEVALAAADERAQALCGIDASDAVEAVDFANPRAEELAARHGGRAFDIAAQPLAAVNGLLLGAGAVLRLGRGKQGAVRLRNLGAAYQHVLAIVEDGAALTLIEEPSAWTHRIVECVVGEQAELRHLRRQGADAAQVRECSLVAAHLAAGARYALAQSSLGAQMRRNDIAATLAGANADVRISAAWRLATGRHLDNQVRVRHEAAARESTSRQLYRGVVGAGARAVLNGSIRIASGASGTDAGLNVKHLLESASAEVYAKPELEIYEGDVKCSHGAAVGALDENAVYYLRSRGVPHARARELLAAGFLREAVADEDGAHGIGVLAARPEGMDPQSAAASADGLQ